jgi:hypothetical protein
VVGTYKRSFRKRETQSDKGYGFNARVWNTAPHARYVEYGRVGSRKRQVFSRRVDVWVESKFWGMRRYKGPQFVLRKAGHVYTWKRTGAREGQEIMERAARHIASLRGTRWYDNRSVAPIVL